MRWVGHVARIMKEEIGTKFQSGNKTPEGIFGPKKGETF
jgi:hypothetical protein